MSATHAETVDRNVDGPVEGGSLDPGGENMRKCKALDLFFTWMIHQYTVKPRYSELVKIYSILKTLLMPTHKLLRNTSGIKMHALLQKFRCKRVCYGGVSYAHECSLDPLDTLRHIRRECWRSTSRKKMLLWRRCTTPNYEERPTNIPTDSELGRDPCVLDHDF